MEGYVTLRLRIGLISMRPPLPSIVLATKPVIGFKSIGLWKPHTRSEIVIPFGNSVEVSWLTFSDFPDGARESALMLHAIAEYAC